MSESVLLRLRAGWPGLDSRRGKNFLFYTLSMAPLAFASNSA
jgi:hypothetical protein